jgi:hypothetical protein
MVLDLLAMTEASFFYFLSGLLLSDVGHAVPVHDGFANETDRLPHSDSGTSP